MRTIGSLGIATGALTLPQASWALSPAAQGRAASSQWGVCSRKTTTFMTPNDNNSDDSGVDSVSPINFDLERGTTGALSFLCASVLLISSMGGGPIVETANAAESLANMVTTKTPTSVDADITSAYKKKTKVVAEVKPNVSTTPTTTTTPSSRKTPQKQLTKPATVVEEVTVAPTAKTPSKQKTKPAAVLKDVEFAPKVKTPSKQKTKSQPVVDAVTTEKKKTPSATSAPASTAASATKKKTNISETTTKPATKKDAKGETSKKKADAPKSKQIDPLASEKGTVSAAKDSLSAASLTLGDAKKKASVEQKAYDKAVANTAAAEKRVKAAKAALIDANDKVVAEKAKGNTSTSDLKNVQKLGENIGMARDTLLAKEANLVEAKAAGALQLKAINVADSTVAKAASKELSFKDAVPRAQANLKVAEKKLVKSNKISKKNAAKAAKKQAVKDKVAMKKSMVAEKKQKAANRAKRKAEEKNAKLVLAKKAAEIKALKAKVKELKTVGKESSSELIKQEKALQKIGA